MVKLGLTVRPLRGTIIMVAKIVDSYRFLHGIEKSVLKRWAWDWYNVRSRRQDSAPSRCP